MKLILQNRNIFFLFLIGFFSNFMVMMPILTLYFMENGLNMTEVMILQTVFSVLIVVLEIPSGYLADIFKRKYSIIIGSLFSFLGILGYYFAGGFWGFLVVEVLLGIAISFISGAETAYLYDELISKKQEKKYLKIEGAYSSLSTFSESMAAFVSGFIALISFKAVVIVQIIATFLAFISSFFLQEHKRNLEIKDKLNMKEVFKFILKDNDKIKYLIGFSAFIGASTLVFVWIAQPFWKEMGLPLAYFGIVWGILNLLVSVGALFSHKLEEKFSFKQIFIFFWICSFIFYVILYFTNNIYIALIISSGFWIFRGLNGPILRDYVNREVESRMRATVLSIKNLSFRIVFSILSPFIGYFGDIYDLHTSLLVSGTVFLIFTGIFLILLFVNYNRKCDICIK